MEWLIGLIPLPYVAACLLLTILLSYPGLALVFYLDGRLTDLVSFPSNPVEQLTFVVGMIVNALIFFYLFFTVRFMRLKVVETSEQLRPLSRDQGETFERIFAPLSSFWPPLIIGIVAVAFLHLLLSFSQGGDAFPSLLAFLFLRAPPPDIGPFRTAQLLVNNGLFVAAIGTFVWVYFRTLWGLHLLGREPLSLKTYREDSMLGLRPIGSLSLVFTGIYFVWLVLLALSSLPNPTLFDVVYPIPLIALGVVMFFLPLTNVHRAMTTQRRKEQSLLREWFNKILGETNPPGSERREGSLVEVSKLLSELRGVMVLDMLRGDVAETPTWPFDTVIIRRFVVLVSSITTSLIAHMVQVSLGL